MPPTQNPNLPLYKLHDAPRAAPFGADPNRMAIEPNPPPAGMMGHHHRQPQQQQQQQQQQQHHAQHPRGSPQAQRVPSASIQLHPPQPRPQQQQLHPPRILTKTNPILPQGGLSPESPSVDQPANTAASTIANAHFGHSLYFIEHLFPSKLWRILDDAERYGYENVISWVDNGMAFQIHDRENVIPILEKYFNMSKYKSFLRQLQAYGFQRALPNPKDDPLRDSKGRSNSYRGKWSHKLFRRDKMNLCNKMTRDGKTKQDKEPSQQQQQHDKTNKTHVVKKIVPPRVVSSGPPMPSHSPTGSSVNGNLKQQHHRINQSQAAIVKHQQQQKELAAMGQQHQHHLQLMHKRLLQQQQQQQQHTQQQQQQQQQHHTQQPTPPGMYHHDPRYPPQQHPPPQASFHHPQHHPPPTGATQPPHPGAPPPATTGTSGLSPSLLARVQQQQEEHARQQLTIQIQHIKEQQLLSSILAKSRPKDASAKVPSPQLSSISSAPAKAPGPQAMLEARNYNHQTSSVPPSAAKGVPSATKTASDAVTEAANELHRAELALIERRKRLLEAQERALKEAEALAEAEAAVLAHSRGAEVVASEPSPSSAAASASRAETSAALSTAAAAKELLLRRAPTNSDASTAKPLTAPSSMALLSSEAEKARTAGKSLIGGLPLTSLLEDLDNAFKSSTAAKLPPPQGGDAGNKPSAVLSNGAITNNNTTDQLKITEEELLRARAEAAAASSAASAPSPMDHVMHRPQHQLPPTSSDPGAATAPGGGKSSPEPSASEREVILARLNAMEQIRIRERQQQQQQQQQHHKQQQAQQQQHHKQQQQQQAHNQQLLLMNIAMAEREEHQQQKQKQQQQQQQHNQQLLIAIAERDERERIRRGVAGTAGTTSVSEANAAVANAASSAAKAAVRDAIRNAAAPGMIRNPPHGSSVLPPAQQPPPGVLSKEMMDIFAKTAAAAISSKSGENSGSDSNYMAPAAAGKRPASQISTDRSSPSLRHQKSASSSTPGSPVRSANAPSEASITAAPPPESSVVTSSELEAARALMRIPGSISQSKEKPMMGHWELVRQEELKSGSSLAKALPDAVTKAADLPYEKYKTMATKMTPPPAIRIPDGWNPRKDPFYLVVDQANAASAAARAPLPQASVAMAMNAPPIAVPSSVGARGSVGASQLLKGPSSAGAPGLR